MSFKDASTEEEHEDRKGKTYKIKSGAYKDNDYRVEDTVMNVLGRSWIDHKGNAGCIEYMVRMVQDGLPIDNNVYYGKIGGLGHIIHESELGEEVVV